MDQSGHRVGSALSKGLSYTCGSPMKQKRSRHSSFRKLLYYGWIPGVDERVSRKRSHSMIG